MYQTLHHCDPLLNAHRSPTQHSIKSINHIQIGKPSDLDLIMNDNVFASLDIKFRIKTHC